MKKTSVTTQFVELMPSQLQEGVLYISEKYATAIHKCCCGCGREVVTPLSPAKWQLRRDGEIVTLHPSIGNWNFPCQSHYWIRRNRVEWSGSMTEQQIRRVQTRDERDSQRYIKQVNARKENEILSHGATKQYTKKSSNKPEPYWLWQWMKDWWRHK